MKDKFNIQNHELVMILLGFNFDKYFGKNHLKRPMKREIKLSQLNENFRYLNDYRECPYEFSVAMDMFFDYIKGAEMETDELHSLMEFLFTKITSVEIIENIAPSIMDQIDKGIQDGMFEYDLYIAHTVLIYLRYKKQHTDINLPTLTTNYPILQQSIHTSLVGFVNQHHITSIDVKPTEIFPGLNDFTAYQYFKHYKHSFDKLEFDARFDDLMYGYFTWHLLH